MFAETQVICVPANRSFGLFGHGHRLLPRQSALRCLRGRKSFASLQTGPSVFSGTGIACLPREQALRCLRGRRSIASLQTGPSFFSGTGIACFPNSRPCGVCGTQVVCVPANWPFSLFGHGYRMVSRQQALRCLRGRKSFASLPTGPSDFSGTGIACFPNNRPEGLFVGMQSMCGAANSAGPVVKKAYHVRRRKSRWACPQGRIRCAAPPTPPGLLSGKHTMCVAKKSEGPALGEAYDMRRRYFWRGSSVLVLW